MSRLSVWRIGGPNREKIGGVKLAVRIRLKRMGTSKKPRWRIIVADAQMPRDGRVVDEIGYYDPSREPSVIEVDVTRLKGWLEKGAKPSQPVTKLLREKNILS